MTKKLKLVSKEYTTDAIGQKVAEETEREIFCDVMSISQKEFQTAGLVGMRPIYEFRVWLSEYHGEEVCIYEGERYSIYRAYSAGDRRIELYVQKEVTS